MTTRRITVVALIAALALTACDSNSGGPDGAGPSSTRADQALQFARCMREHSVPMADPAGDDAPQVLPTGPVMDAALLACRQYLPDGGQPDPAADRDLAARLARCLRAHGVDVPDPDQADSTGAPRELTPAEAAIEQQCRKDLAATPSPTGR